MLKPEARTVCHLGANSPGFTLWSRTDFPHSFGFGAAKGKQSTASLRTVRLPWVSCIQNTFSTFVLAVWNCGQLLVVLNSSFYHQHLNKIKQIWIPKFKIMVYNSQTMNFGIYMFCRTTRENIPKCTNEKAHSSKTTSKAHPNFRLGPEHQRGSHPGPASNPLEQGGGEWAGPGWCERTAPSSVWPHHA
jgi:hypothetical protein